MDSTNSRSQLIAQDRSLGEQEQKVNKFQIHGQTPHIEYFQTDKTILELELGKTGLTPSYCLFLIEVKITGTFTFVHRSIHNAVSQMGHVSEQFLSHCWCFNYVRHLREGHDTLPARSATDQQRGQETTLFILQRVP